MKVTGSPEARQRCGVLEEWRYLTLVLPGVISPVAVAFPGSFFFHDNFESSQVHHNQDTQPVADRTFPLQFCFRNTQSH